MNIVDSLTRLVTHDKLGTVCLPPGTDLSMYADGSVQAVILSDIGLITEAYRVLAPGGYLFTIADDAGTSVSAACNAEDAGFEVRDAICVVESGDTVYPVAKPSRTERDAGISTRRPGHEAVSRKANTKKPPYRCGRYDDRSRELPPDYEAGGGHVPRACRHTVAPLTAV